MRPVGSTKVLANRRQRALALLDQGLTLADVAEIIGCAPSSVLRWRDARRHPPPPRPGPGRPPKLSVAQRRRLLRALAKGPRAHGFPTALWTGPRVARVIAQMFGIEHHPSHVRRLMRDLGWTPQKPERRAVERDEAAIAQWIAEDWPRITKSGPRPPCAPGLRG